MLKNPPYVTYKAQNISVKPRIFNGEMNNLWFESIPFYTFLYETVTFL